jgi:hypothetical protein
MPEVISILALTSEFLGTLLIGLAVLKVHARIRVEHKIDRRVRRIIKKERTITLLGLILITLGFILNFI